MFNDFSNDSHYLAPEWLARLLLEKGYSLRAVFRIEHRVTAIVHYLFVLEDGRCICDCCMPMNMGIPCRHYWAAWQAGAVFFHISLVSKRYIRPIVAMHIDYSFIGGSKILTFRRQT